MVNSIMDAAPKFSEFTYWFTLSDTPGQLWDVRRTDDLSTIIDSSIDPDGISADLKKFESRPEYSLTQQIADIDTANEEFLVMEYCRRLVGISLLRAAKKGFVPDDNTKSVTAAIDYLQSTDFFSAPASTQYHESIHTGLLRHSLKVLNQILILHVLPQFCDAVPLDSAVLAALVHDWCKIGLYESYTRNVKNETTGQWEKVLAFKHNQRGIPLGHGVTSMYLASKFFRLSVEEAVAIRHHMGRWNTPNSEFNELQLANHTYPLVYLLQFADQLSITHYIK